MSQPIVSHTLRDGPTEVTVLSVGCAIQDWQVAGRRVVLGYADTEDYRSNPVSMGVVVGRVANRISNASFELGGKAWSLPVKPGASHHIHGGPQGLGWRHWQPTPIDESQVELRLTSPHLDQGYPGEVAFLVRLSLEGTALTWDMTATPDRETPINLAQHVYFNLAGTGRIDDHRFQIAADRFTPNDETLIPTGEITPVAETRFDFRQMRTLKQADPADAGYDLNYVLRGAEGPHAHVETDDMSMHVWTDRPGLQFYTSNTLKSFGTPWPEPTHGPKAGYCLEAQDFPNALNTDGFGSILYTPERPYRQRTTIDIFPRG